MGLDKVWEDETSRAVEVLGGEPQKYSRSLDDKLVLKFTNEEWRKLFNVAEGYMPCDPTWNAYDVKGPIHVHFIRRVTDERT